MSGRITLLLVGLVFTLIGGCVAIFVPTEMYQEANRIEAMTPLSATILEDSQPGREVLVEGRISNRTNPVYRNLVAYKREVRVYDDDDYEWRTRATVTPPLLVDLPGGLIQVAADYELRDVPSTHTIHQGDTRYTGFVAGDQVLIVGERVRGLELPEIRAEFVAGGTQQSFVEGQRWGAVFSMIFGGIFLLVGLGMMVGSVWGAVKRMAGA